MRTEAQQAAVVAQNVWSNAVDAQVAAQADWDRNPCEATNKAVAVAKKAQERAWRVMDRAEQRAFA